MAMHRWADQPCLFFPCDFLKKSVVSPPPTQRSAEKVLITFVIDDKEDENMRQVLLSSSYPIFFSFENKNLFSTHHTLPLSQDDLIRNNNCFYATFHPYVTTKAYANMQYYFFVHYLLTKSPSQPKSYHHRLCHESCNTTPSIILSMWCIIHNSVVNNNNFRIDFFSLSKDDL